MPGRRGRRPPPTVFGPDPDGIDYAVASLRATGWLLGAIARSTFRGVRSAARLVTRRRRRR